MDDGTRKPVVILIHGGGGNKDETLPWAVSLAEQGFYALSIDAAAHGGNTSGPLDALKCWVVTVTQIDAVLDHYAAAVSQADTERLGIAGGSMGGAICFAYGAHGKYTPDVIVSVSGTPDYTQMSDSPLYDRYGSGEPAEAFMTEDLPDFNADDALRQILLGDESESVFD